MIKPPNVGTEMFGTFSARTRELHIQMLSEYAVLPNLQETVCYFLVQKLMLI
jgi:hypothetical protein